MVDHGTAIETVLAGHAAAQWRRAAILIAAAAALLAMLVLDVVTGPALLSVGEVVRTLWAPSEAGTALRAIVWDLRLPMALMAVVVGVALGASGAAMQTLLANPLASPYTLGLSAAAGFGAALAISSASWGLPSTVMVPLTAFAAACCASAVIFGIGGSGGGAQADTMILTGIALLFMFNALQSLVLFLAAPEIGQQITFWLFGSLAKATWSSLAITAAVVGLGMPVLMRNAWRLTALQLGSRRAGSLGIDVGRLRLLTIAVVSLVTATAISFVGTIGFVGLIGPHVARMLVGEDQRFMMPLAAIAGALLLSAASVVSKVVMPGVLVPIGIVTALVGVPFFMHLIVMRRRLRVD